MHSTNSKAVCRSPRCSSVVRWIACSMAMLLAMPAVAQFESMTEPRRMRTQSEPMSGLPQSAVVPATASSIRNTPVPAAVENLPGRDRSRGIELKGPSQKETQTDRPSANRSSMLTTLLALGVVVALFLGVNVALKRFQPKAMRRLPNAIVEVLGTTTLGPKHQLLLLRFGNKLLLVSQQPGETHCLSEVAEPHEVDALLAHLENAHPSPQSKTPAELVTETLLPSKRRRGPIAAS